MPPGPDGAAAGPGSGRTLAVNTASAAESAQAEQALIVVKDHWPWAARLARLVSLAVRVEPSLLRAARLAAGLDAVAEADLWFSGIVASRSTLGISLAPSVAEALRAELTGAPADRDLAWQLLEDHHGREPWSIRLEERVNYLTTQSPVDVEPRSPSCSVPPSPNCTRSASAMSVPRSALRAGCWRRWPGRRLRRVRRRWLPRPKWRRASISMAGWLAPRTWPVPNPVGCFPGCWIISAASWFRCGRCPPAWPSAVTQPRDPLPVPRTDPLVISVSSGTGRPPGQVDVRLHSGEDKLVPVAGSRVELRTITGGGLVLRRAGIGRILANVNDRGAGFAVTGQAVLTAAHNLPDNVVMQAAWSADRAIYYVTESGESVPAEISATDAELDAVLLRLAQPVPDVLPIGDSAAGVGCRVQVQGPAGRQALRGTVLGTTHTTVGGGSAAYPRRFR